MKTMKQTLLVLAGIVALAAGLAAQTAQPKNVQINGAGATFPYPIYSKWFDEYNKLHTNIRINYQSLGSGAGIRQITAQTVFFGATDGPMTNDQLLAAPGRILHFPTVLGAVVPVYNVPGVSAEVKFTGQLLADIFLGKITRWSDPAIAKLNPGVTFPGAPITVVHRAEGSGTTYIFVDYLSKVSPEWKQKVGVANAVQWPVGLGGQGNEGVAGLVSQTPGSIGYVELIYATQNKIAYGSVQNMAGEFVRASEPAVTAAAAEAAKQMPADFRVSITNAPGKGVYPISSFTWILLYENAKDKNQAKIMVDFMKWALADGQKLAPGLGYAPLPADVIKLELAALAKVKISSDMSEMNAPVPGTSLRSRRYPADLAFRVGTGAFAFLIVLIVFGIGVELTRHSMLSIQKFGLSFWTTQVWNPVTGDFGALPFIWGTLYSSILALVISTPVALGIAIFVSELCPSRFRQPLVFLTELLAAIPSIVYGLWGIFVLIPLVREFEYNLPESLAAIPLFSGPPVGVGMLSAGLILAIMIIPFTSSVAREVLKSVPMAQREGAYALGATRFEAIRAALFYARTGIVGAVMLGFGRALGETMAVTMVIGNTPKLAVSLFAPQSTMASVLASQFSEADTELYLDALIEIGLVLFIITLIINALSRLLIWSMARSGSKARVAAPVAVEAAA